MTFEEYEHEHLFALTECAKKLVRMGWNARGSHCNCQGILDSSGSEASITPEMIEVGARRLVAWEDGSVWPDSWSPMVVAAARNDAERVLRSALNVRTDHIPDATKMIAGNVVAAGQLTDNDDEIYSPAMLIEFASVEDFHAARAAGQCRFMVFGGDV